MAGVYDNIREVAKSKKVTIRSLEERAGISAGGICKWNSVSPSVKRLKRVADLLEVTVDSLVEEK